MSMDERSLAAWIARLCGGEEPPPPILALLGIRVVDAAAGSATLSFAPQPAHHNAMGTLHGGVICDLADAAMGFALATEVGGVGFTTVELKANYFKPIVDQPLIATASVVRRTRALAMVTCDVTDPGGSLVARVSSTCMFVPSRS